jgi:uncharacterized Zn finger protein
VCACPDRHRAGKHSAAGNVNVIANPAIMLYYCTAIDYDITA